MFQIEFKQLSGSEKLRLFEQIDINNLFLELQNRKKVEELWKNFFNIYVSVKNNAYPIKTRVEDIKTNTKKWVSDFISIYQSQLTSHLAYIHLVNICGNL